MTIQGFAQYYGTTGPKLLVQRMIERSHKGPLTMDVPLVKDVVDMMHELEMALDGVVAQREASQ